MTASSEALDLADKMMREHVATHMEIVVRLMRSYAENPEQFSPILKEFLANNMATLGTWLLADAEDLQKPPLPT